MKNLIVAIAASLPSIMSASDPAAAKILDRTYHTYLSYTSLDLQFTFTHKQAESKPVVQKGSFTCKDKAFRVILPDQEIYNNGISQWTLLKKNKEVQITDAGEALPFYHPHQLANLYKSGQYEYRVYGKVKMQQADVHIIELVPKDRDDPVFKIQLYINAQSQIVKANTFHKNGERNTLEIFHLKPNSAIPDSLFIIPEHLLRSHHVEDLRE